MNAPLKPAHSPFGGSVAARVLRCPASVGLVETVPAHLRKSSSYAARGTALHSAMALLIEQKRDINALVGETIDGYAVTTDDVETALRPVLAYVDTLPRPSRRRIFSLSSASRSPASSTRSAPPT